MLRKILLAVGALFAVFLAYLTWSMLRSWHHPLIEAISACMLLATLPSALAEIARRRREADMAPLIAVVGCDGSGKSTLTGDIVDQLAADIPIATCYLGLGTGDMGERIKRWPVIGAAFERKLSQKATQARTKGQKIPGLLTALVIFTFSLIRCHRFNRMLRLRRKGIAVVTDRYPQIEVPGFYDGPGLSAARAGGPLVAWLARRERALYEGMADFRPDLVIRLNVDVETALHRKPDHKRSSLEAKVAVTPTLSFRGARLIDLDACQPYENVRGHALQTIQNLLGNEQVSALMPAR